MNVPDPRLRWLRFNEIVMELLHVLVDPSQNFGKEKHVLSIKIQILLPRKESGLEQQYYFLFQLDFPLVAKAQI